MFARWVNLLLLFAMTATLSGMAPAAPVAGDAHHATTVGRHCADQPADGPAGHALGQGCTMACASATPAFQRTPISDPPLRSSADFARPNAASAPDRLVLEIATPPPRLG